MSIEQGKVVEGVVTGITSFGAFVQIPNNLTGLVHISEIDHEYVRDVNDFLKVNDRIKVKVISVDEKGKIGLSIKQAKPAPQSRQRRPSLSFEDKMAKFLKESEERQQQLRKNQNAAKRRQFK